MTTADQNFLLLQEIEANRRFLLMAYEQNPKLLQNAEPRIKQLFEEKAANRDMSAMEKSSGRQRGVSLIELIIFIVIISTALIGILAVMNQTTAHSADPLVRKQALAIAESLLEEVELMPFTFCDPDDLNAATATSPTVGGNGCNSTAEAMGPEAAYAQQAAAETRGNAQTPFDNVNDYNGFTQNPATNIIAAQYPGYSASVAVTQEALPGGVAATEALRITVTVTAPGGDQIVLDGYRTRFAPRAL